MQKLEKYKKISMAVLVIVACFSLFGCAANKDGEKSKSSNEPKSGGTATIAFSADPETIDWMYTGASSTRDVGWHIFETLFALDKNYKIKPMIADSYEVSQDQKVYTIKIRKGVTFHNGNEVTAKDVAASIERWRKVSGVGIIANNHIESVKDSDEQTVIVTLKDVYEPLLADMAAPKSALAIIPSEIAEKAGEEPLKPDQLIGTGPFKFSEWKRGNEIILNKFKEYKARSEEDWGGLTGKKQAYLDEIKFKIVKDSQVALNGLKTNQYDYAQSIPPDLFEVIEGTKGISPITYINGYTMLTPNEAKPPFNNLKARQALALALDKKAIAQAAYGNDKFYQLDGALFDPDQKSLYTDQHTENYLKHDVAKAKQLLKESGYDGKPIKIMFANNFPRYKNIAEISKQQLEAVGFKVELVQYEWATYLEKWGNPNNWDLVAIGWSTRYSPNELGMLGINTSSSGWYKSKRWEDLIDRWGSAKDENEKKEILGEINCTL